MKPLAEKYHLILIDIIGMGSSSRPKFTAKTGEQSDLFFVDFIEKWRIAMGDLKGFILAGHSFGGYICGHYAAKYPQHLKKLLMLSPVGVPIKQENEGIPTAKFKNGKQPPKLVRTIAKTVWAKKWSPFGVMRKSGKWIGKKMIKRYTSNRMAMLPKEELADMQEYMQ